MKYATAILATAGLVAAQSAADFFPECAIPCLDEAVLSVTDCTLEDPACQCTEANHAAIQGASTSCIIDACTAAVAVGEVLPASEAFCAAVGTGESEDPTPTETETPEDPVETEEPEVEDPVETQEPEEEEEEEDAGSDGTTTPTPTPAPTGNGTDSPNTELPVTAGAPSFGTAGSVLMAVLGMLAL